MSKKSLIILCAIAGFLFLAPLTRSSTYTVEKTTQIGAPTADVFALINDLHAWSQWSPWQDLDPKAKREFSGPAAGQGATMTFEGTELGAGKLTITRAGAPEAVTVEATFTAPASNPATLDFQLRPMAGATLVTWKYEGHHTMMEKYSALVVDAKLFIGRDLESGLASLKSVAEAAQAEKAAAVPVPEAEAAAADGGAPEAPAADAGTP